MTGWLQRLRIGIFTILAVSGAGAAASAQTAPLAGTFEELPARLKIGTRVSVVDEAGRRVNGTVGAVSAESIAVYARGLHPMDYQFDRGQINEITTIDSTRDGFWFGFALGAVPGVVLATLINRYCDNESPTPNSCARAYPILGGVGGFIGGVVGVAMDGAVNHGSLLYARPSTSSHRVTVQPLATPGTRSGGLTVSVAF